MIKILVRDVDCFALNLARVSLAPMGTLKNQPPRVYRMVEYSDLDEFLSTALQLSKKHQIAVTEVIAASRVLELKRTNDLYVANCDVFDEQIAGIGDLLEKVSSAIEGLGHGR